MSQATIIAALAALVAYLQEEQVVIRATYATVTLVIYEHLITLRREIETMWGTEWTAARYLFIANRYTLLLYAIHQTWPIHGPLGCKAIVYIGYVLSSLQIIIIALFSALRAHAFCGRKLWVAAVVVFALNLLPLAADFYFWATSPVTYIADGNDFGPLANICGNETSSANSAQLRSLTLASRIGVLVADVLLVALTWRQTLRFSWLATKMLPGPSRFVDIALRDGTIYFIVMLAMNLIMICLTTVSETQSNDPVVLFLLTLPPILTSRFLLNLRGLYATNPDVDEWSNGSTTLSAWPSSPKFVGDMGGVLKHDQDGFVFARYDEDATIHRP